MKEADEREKLYAVIAAYSVIPDGFTLRQTLILYRQVQRSRWRQDRKMLNTADQRTDVTWKIMILKDSRHST